MKRFRDILSAMMKGPNSVGRVNEINGEDGLGGKTDSDGLDENCRSSQRDGNLDSNATA